ncbi:MAG TPA: hypothetical protein VGQ17_15585 [Gemmatimonadales bacterium]|jgi:hypothetical protein|nr:hypothetical protein [Gemmatimonadales bacterium]
MIVTPRGPGAGPAWERLAEALRTAIPVGEVDRIWTFPIVRREGRDFGTAVLSRVDGERRRILTARFAHTVKGKKRGEFEWHLDEVGSGPLEALDELLALVPKRSDEEEPPSPVDPALWFPADLDAETDAG